MALQMTCPFCKKEFPFDNGRIDAEISGLGQRVTAIIKRISELKAMPYLPDAKKERRALGLELATINKRLSELKSVRKAADQHRHRMEYDVFKQLVRERYGEEEFMKLAEERDRMLQSYTVAETMKHPYTRSNALSTVTSINKL